MLAGSSRAGRANEGVNISGGVREQRGRSRPFGVASGPHCPAHCPSVVAHCCRAGPYNSMTPMRPCRLAMNQRPRDHATRCGGPGGLGYAAIICMPSALLPCWRVCNRRTNPGARAQRACKRSQSLPACQPVWQPSSCGLHQHLGPFLGVPYGSKSRLAGPSEPEPGRLSSSIHFRHYYCNLPLVVLARRQAFPAGTAIPRSSCQCEPPPACTHGETELETWSSKHDAVSTA